MEAIDDERLTKGGSEVRRKLRFAQQTEGERLSEATTAEALNCFTFAFRIFWYFLSEEIGSKVIFTRSN